MDNQSRIPLGAPMDWRDRVTRLETQMENVATAEQLALAVGSLTQLTTSAWHGLKRDYIELKSELKLDTNELKTELKGDIAGLRTEVKSDIVELRSEFKADIAELKVELKASFTDINNKFAGIDDKFAGINDKFTGIDDKFTGIDDKFAGINDQFEAINERFIGVYGAMSAMEVRLIKWMVSSVTFASGLAFAAARFIH